MKDKEQATEVSEQLDKIVAKAAELFLNIGIRSITLDAIASELGISKKTIYAHFDNKGQLVFETVKRDLKIKQEQVRDIQSQKYNAIEEMLHIGKSVMQSLSSFSVNIIMDLMKFYPESWQLIEQHKDDFVFDLVVGNIRKGKKQGFYRDNISEDIVARLFIGFTDSIVSSPPAMKGDSTLSEIYKEHLLHHMYALCTEEGRKELETLLTTLKLTI